MKRQGGMSLLVSLSSDIHHRGPGRELGRRDGKENVDEVSWKVDVVRYLLREQFKVLTECTV